MTKKNTAPIVFRGTLRGNDEVMLSGGSIDEDCMRIGVYKRNGSIFPPSLGYMLLPFTHVQNLIDDLSWRLAEYLEIQKEEEARIKADTEYEKEVGEGEG